jgi:hypothetical protein
VRRLLTVEDQERMAEALVANGHSLLSVTTRMELAAEREVHPPRVVDREVAR